MTLTPENGAWVQTSRSLVSPVHPAFRLEEVNGGYDLVYQANGEDEEIRILMDDRDFDDLRRVINLAYD